MNREIVISHHNHFVKMFISGFKLRDIKINVTTKGYYNFYEVIRGLNHEELHFILLNLIDFETGKQLDNLIQLGFSGYFESYREIYELASKTTSEISIEELTLEDTNKYLIPELPLKA